MKIIMDPNRCEANAVCVSKAPEVFRVDDDDTLHILMDTIPEAYRTQVEAAVRTCPRQALRLED